VRGGKGYFCSAALHWFVAYQAVYKMLASFFHVQFSNCCKQATSKRPLPFCWKLQQSSSVYIRQNMTSQVVTAALEMADRSVPSTSAETEELDSVRSSDTASTGIPKHETTQVNTQSVRDELLPSKRGNKSAKQSQVPMHIEYPFKKHVLYSLVTVIAIGIASLISVCWLIAYIQTKSKNEHPYITAEIVGGRFSSTAAKLIDAAFSMLVAPAIIAIANWHIFKLARLSAVNEHHGRSSAVSMKVLVEVANTDWGSFSPLKFWTFARSKRPRVICLGAVAVLSALSFALLSNVVAYQAGMMLEYL
jgi:hypothetical protein